MRYLSLAGFVVVAGAVAAFACGDGDSLKTGPSAGDAGEAGAHAGGGSAGTAASGGKGGKGGNGGNAGKGGSAGTAAEAGAPMGGTSGEGGEAAGGDAGAGGEPQAPNSLKITLNGVPVGSTASVSIAGPAGFVENISASTTLADVVAGTYTITAPSIRVPGTQVDSIFDATVVGGPVEVVLGAAATASVNYARRPGTGMLWGTNYSSPKVFGFDAATIAKTGTQSGPPSVVNTLTNVGTNKPPSPTIAFSATGDLWVGTCRKDQIPQVVAKFSPAKLSATGNPVADVTLTLPATDTTYDCADALVFDAAGNLWVGMNHGHILSFNASDLTVTGTPAPAVNLTSSAYFVGVLDLAFDSSGNLFVASYGTPIISRLSASQLLASDPAVVPAVRLTLAASVGPGGLVLDKDGSLWVSQYNAKSIVKLSAADLGTTGTPTPALTLTGVPGPEQLAFDNAGNLWVAAFDAGSVIALSAVDITTGGSKTPLTALDNDTIDVAFGLRFNPGAP